MCQQEVWHSDFQHPCFFKKVGCVICVCNSTNMGSRDRRINHWNLLATSLAKFSEKPCLKRIKTRVTRWDALRWCPCAYTGMYNNSQQSCMHKTHTYTNSTWFNVSAYRKHSLNDLQFSFKRNNAVETKRWQNSFSILIWHRSVCLNKDKPFRWRQSLRIKTIGKWSRYPSQQTTSGVKYLICNYEQGSFDH